MTFTFASPDTMNRDQAIQQIYKNPQLQERLDRATERFNEVDWRLGFLRTIEATPPPPPDPIQLLDWHKQYPLPYVNEHLEAIDYPNLPKSLNEQFTALFPAQTKQYGESVVEKVECASLTEKIYLPFYPNYDFFAASLSDPVLGLNVIYYLPEMQFYYHEPIQKLYKPVEPEKLQALYRGLLVRAGKRLFNLKAQCQIWEGFASDKSARTVITRAKSILAANSSFFSATSPHQRIKGIELHERVARRFVDDLLSSEPGNVLQLKDAYFAYLQLIKKQNLEEVKRNEFRDMVIPLIRDRFEVGLRGDLELDGKSSIRGWKNVKLCRANPG